MGGPANGPQVLAPWCCSTERTSRCCSARRTSRCDTNICIYNINAKPAAVLRRFQQYRMGEIGLCSVVAAHALSQQAPLVTNNTREFAMVPELRLENWVP